MKRREELVGSSVAKKQKIMDSTNEKPPEDEEEEEEEVRDQREESARAVAEAKPHVRKAELSECLESSFSVAYINLWTYESRVMCVRFSREICEIVGDEFDTIKQCTATYESVHELLTDASPAYRYSVELAAEGLKFEWG